METSQRRLEILRMLCRRRHETISNMAAEFGVSERTIRRDIDILSLSQPIYTQPGRYGGGVYVTENFNMDRMYFRDSESDVLTKILGCVQSHSVCELSAAETGILINLIADYTKPKNTKKKRGSI